MNTIYLPQAPTTPDHAPARRAPSHEYQIRIVTSDADREAVARLRYEVYVAELGRVQPCADHASRTIHEPLDDEGVVFGAFTPEGRLIGTMRIAPSTAASIESRQMYGWEPREQTFPGAVVHASKLLTDPAFRGSLLGSTLMRVAACEALHRGWRFAFLETYDELVPLYTRVGFVARGSRVDPVYGSVTIMEWDMHDVEHMRRVRSPMLRDLLDLLPERTAA